MTDETQNPSFPDQIEDPIKAEHMAYGAARIMDIALGKQDEHDKLMEDPDKVVGYDETEKGIVLQRKGRPITNKEIAQPLADEAGRLRNAAMFHAEKEGEIYDKVVAKEPEYLPHIESTTGITEEEYGTLSMGERKTILEATETKREHTRKTIELIGNRKIDDLTPQDFEKIARHSLKSLGSAGEYPFYEDNLHHLSTIQRKIELRRSTNRGADHALNLIESRFGPEQGDNYLTFHGPEHTRNVINRVEKINDALLETLAITDKEASLAVLAAGFHDTVQNSRVVADPNNPAILKRQRDTGQNEVSSADEAEAYMREENARAAEANGNPSYVIYTNQDIAVVREAIETTIPGWDPEAQTVIQPKLSKAASNVSYILALADIGNVGIDGSEAAVRDSDKLFLEENVDILRAVRTGDIDAEKQDWYKTRANASLASQLQFIEGRQSLLDKEISIFPSEAVRKLKKQVFGKFDESLATVQAKYEARLKMRPDEVIADLIKTSGVILNSAS